MKTEDVKDVVREKYGQAALRAKTGEASSCCGGSGAVDSCCEPITSNLYDAAQEGEVPDLALRASLGCGNPTALAELKVDEMLAVAEENKRKSGLENVEFLKGEIERIPLPDNSVDVIISNCVINLSGDKDRVIGEAFRVLRPGGRLAVSDVVVRGEVPAAIRKSMELWVGCVAGALGDYEYVAKLAKAGFDGIDIETTRVYSIQDARTFLAAEGLDVDALAKDMDGTFVSGVIRATKPAAATCCGPTCCH
jgi:arsenite methyltransferase